MIGYFGCVNFFYECILLCVGYYVYIEIFWQFFNDIVVLYSLVVFVMLGKFNKMVCLQFWYYMYGQYVDMLNLFMK